ncbi:MAG: ABC transporter ATP-binding protein [Lachnospiraceae bacterium]|nr:ABC transporter ATP-binding protein [Lachnospiraceae bacterium]
MLELMGFQKHYGDFHLNCSLKVQKGCITGLIGQNGAGKTTIFKSILGLIAGDGGKIRILGKDPAKLTAKDREKTGVVLADSGFSGYLTVSDLVPVMKSLYRDFDADDFRQKCSDFHIPENKKIKEFSTGMKAKLKLLIAMSHQAKLLILDEPTAGLDVMAREGLLDLMREYMEDGERSILISSHISSDLENLCDDLYMIHEGQILLHEDTDVLLGEYGVLKLTEPEFKRLDKQYILRCKKEDYGYSCLTDQKRFYMENYPAAAMEKGSIDQVITMMIRGDRL